MSTDFLIRLYQESDFSQMLKIIRAAARADGEAYLPTEADLRARFATPHPDPRLDPAQDMFVAEAPGSGILAYADGVLRGEPQSPIYQTWCFVPPENRRRGIGRALLEQQWARAKEVAAQLGSGTMSLRTRVFETQSDARALFAEAAMQCVRYFFEMRRDLSPAALRTRPIPHFDLPADLKLEAWAEQRQDHAVWEASNEAFLDHWGSAPRRFESFEQQLTLGQIQPENSYLIWEGETLAGGTLNTMGLATAERLGRNQGWISQLFVRRPWRRRGLGRALLIASLRRAQTLGHESVGLNVDAENLTGALRLYESVGFYARATLLIYERVYTASEEMGKE